jgi:hypothetical protein
MLNYVCMYLYMYTYIEWASARVPPTPLLGGWGEGGWSILSNPVTSQILARNLVPSTQLAPS